HFVLLPSCVALIGGIMLILLALGEGGGIGRRASFRC
ncbi:DUF1435 family protein, partial [Klebsiella oxytoca]